MIQLRAARHGLRIGIACAVAMFAVAGQAAAGMCVGVRLRFADRAPSRALVESMQDEAAALWRRYGLRIQWQAEPRAATCAAVQASFDVLVDRPTHAPGTPLSGALGRTRVAPGALAAAPIYIDEDATERVLGLLAADTLMRLTGHPFVARPDLGRALGRVLAHEIGHLVLAARAHQSRGLMRAVFLADDLVAHQRGSYDLSGAELARLRDREAELGPRTASAPSEPGGAGNIQAGIAVVVR